MVRVAYRVMGCGAREKAGMDLASRLGARFWCDREQVGVEWNARRVWSTRIQPLADETHVAVIQDDVTLCRDFLTELPRVLAAVPGRAVTLFGIRKSLTAAAERGGGLVEVPHVWGQANVLPAPLFTAYAEWLRYVHPGTIKHDDVLLSAFLDLVGARALCTVPCLVDHREDMKTVIGNNPPMRRVAHSVLTGEPPDWERLAADIHQDRTSSSWLKDARERLGPLAIQCAEDLKASLRFGEIE